MEDFGDFIKLVVWIIIIAASVLGPMVERWRRKKEEERLRRQADERGAQSAPAEAPAEPEPAQSSGLPYEDIVQEVFGPYIERRKRAAEAARRQAGTATEEADEEEALDEEVRELRETRAPASVPYALLPEVEPTAAAVAQLAGDVPVVTSSARHARTLDERLFSNPRFSAGAKLLLASEILGRPKGWRL